MGPKGEGCSLEVKYRDPGGSFGGTLVYLEDEMGAEATLGYSRRVR